MSERTLSYVGGPGNEGMFVAEYLVKLGTSDRLREASERYSIAEVERVVLGRGTSSSHLRSHTKDGTELSISVLDGWMSGTHAELTKCRDGWLLRDLDSKNGTHINGVRISARLLCDGDLVQTGNTSFLFRDSVERSHLEPSDVRVGCGAPSHETLSPPLARTMAAIARIAQSTVPLIITGETGTGKEVTARYVHACSERSGSFVPVNCGAFPANLIESELFGHKKGAFSGAHADRTGLVQASHGGTLFLDEVAELSPQAQVKLLRVLQEHEVLPVGATKPIAVDLRVVAATHADLMQKVDEGSFRGDLYARLAGAEFRLPSLRDRREDLGFLICKLLLECASDREMRLEREAFWALSQYEWPRNIRELRQALMAAVAMSPTGTIEGAHLPPEVVCRVSKDVPKKDDDGALKQCLIQALQSHRGNVSAVAREMDKARVQIRRWCKRFNLDPNDYR